MHDLCLRSTVFKNHRKSLIQHCELFARKINFHRTKMVKNVKIEKFKWDILAYFKTMCTGILEDFSSWWIVDYCRNPRFLSPAEFGALLAWFLPWSMLPAVQDVQLNFYSINSFSSSKFLGFLISTLYDGSLFC